MLLDLVPAERIKGLSAWGDDPVISAAAEKAAAVSARVSTQQPEQIVALNPDLVIIDTFSDADGSLTRTLTDAGITVLQMSSPTNFDQIKDALATLARAVGEQDAGAALIGEIDAVLNRVAEKLTGLKDADRLKVMYYEDYYDPSGSSAGMLAAYGAGSPFEAVAQAAGLINVCNVANYSAVSKEKVVGEWKPDLLIVPAITYGPDFKAIDDGGASVIQAILADQLMQTLPAVQNDRVKALTERYRSSTAQYMVHAVEELARMAYPDLMQ
jgi:iron complex transport system substrate-binding protein